MGICFNVKYILLGDIASLHRERPTRNEKYIDIKSLKMGPLRPSCLTSIQQLVEADRALLLCCTVANHFP